MILFSNIVKLNSCLNLILFTLNKLFAKTIKYNPFNGSLKDIILN